MRSFIRVPPLLRPRNAPPGAASPDNHGVGVFLLPKVEGLLAGKGDHGAGVETYFEGLQALADRLGEDELAFLAWHLLFFKCC